MSAQNTLLELSATLDKPEPRGEATRKQPNLSRRRRCQPPPMCLPAQRRPQNRASATSHRASRPRRCPRPTRGTREGQNGGRFTPGRRQVASHPAIAERTLERTRPGYVPVGAVGPHGDLTGSPWGGCFLRPRSSRGCGLSLLQPEGLAAVGRATEALLGHPTSLWDTQTLGDTQHCVEEARSPWMRLNIF